MDLDRLPSYCHSYSRLQLYAETCTFWTLLEDFGNAFIYMHLYNVKLTSIGKYVFIEFHTSSTHVAAFVSFVDFLSTYLAD